MASCATVRRPPGNAYDAQAIPCDENPFLIVLRNTYPAAARHTNVQAVGSRHTYIIEHATRWCAGSRVELNKLGRCISSVQRVADMVHPPLQQTSGTNTFLSQHSTPPADMYASKWDGAQMTH
jgi:hypothetical protein